MPPDHEGVSKGFATKKEFRDVLFDRGMTNRVFALTVLRIWAAYELGSMRYGIFTAGKPGRLAS